MKSLYPARKAFACIFLKILLLCGIFLFSNIVPGLSQRREAHLAGDAGSGTIGGRNASVPLQGAMAWNAPAFRHPLENDNDLPNAYRTMSVGFTQQPASDTVCENSDAVFTVAATGTGSLTYQWQLSTDGGSTWSAVTDGSQYSGATSASLTVTGVAASFSSSQYRCMVTDDSGSIPSSAATLTVNAAPAVQTASNALTICASTGTTNFTLSADPGVNYQWQESSDNGAGWNNITDDANHSGSQTTSLSLTNSAFFDGYLYRYTATNATTRCSATSTGVDTLHVLYINITQNPSYDTVCKGSDASFHVTANGNSALTYQWKLFPSGLNVTDNALYSGSTTSTLGVTGATTPNRFTVQVTNSLGCQQTTPFAFLLIQSLTAVTTQPRPDTVCANAPATFSVSAAGAYTNRPLSYQWQTDNGTGGATWSDVAGGTSATLTLPAVTLTMSGYRYRVNVSGTCGTATSGDVPLYVVRSGTWLGAVDTNWHVDGNWCGGVPTSTTDVLIPDWAPRMPTISDATGTAFFQSLTIEDNAQLTIAGGSVDNLSGPFDLRGTVAYTANGDQPVFPAPHGSLEINGSGNKELLGDLAVSHNFVLGGAAKLVTGSHILTMKDGSNPISGATFGGAVTSWVVTGDGSSGATHTGLGGLKIEQVDASDGAVLYPVGPSPASYNPLEFTNSGTIDDFIVAVDDQFIPGGINGYGILRTWNLSEGVDGGSDLTLDMRWAEAEEQTSFDRTQTEVIHSDGTVIADKTATAASGGTDPYTRSGSGFTSMGLYSVQSYDLGSVPLAISLRSFSVRKISGSSARLSWEVTPAVIARTYEVQKSTDGISFTPIGMVSGVESQTLYGFTDNSLDAGTTYYRLKMTGTDLETAFSNVEQVSTHESTDRMELRPSITSGGTAQLFLLLSRSGSFRLTLTDVMGRVQQQEVLPLNKGTHLMPLDISRLPAGLYYLHIAGSHGEMKVLTLVKK